MLLQVLSIVGTLCGFVFATLSLASGLYYISELIESKCEPTKKFLSKAIYGIIITFALLMVVDRFPIKLCLLSIFSNIVYYQNLKKFPFINLGSIFFIGSIVLVILNHYLWFRYFNNIEIPPQFKYDPKYIPQKRANFAEVASFFGIMIWFVPFALFISLSAADQTLPLTSGNEGSSGVIPSSSSGSISTSGKKTRKMQSIGKVVISTIKEYFELLIGVFSSTQAAKNKKFDRLV
ncbi:hypothetical protein ACO0QE_001674 [Hanseniaspora vineae]